MTPNRAAVEPAATAGADGAPIDLEDLLAALTAVRDGDFSVRLPDCSDGTLAAIAERFNEVVAANAERAEDLERAALIIGREGRLTERLPRGTRGGAWASSADAINALIDDLVRPTTEVARVIA